jgi:hypothetical protein
LGLGLGLGLGFARMSLFARESTGELDVESMGEVGEDAILEVHSWSGVAVAMPSLLIWFGIQRSSRLFLPLFGGGICGVHFGESPFSFLYTFVIEVSPQLKTCTLKQQ